MKLTKSTEGTGKPSIDDCMAHRCLEHKFVRQINATVADGSECGACIAADTAALYDLNLELLDGYADRLEHHAILASWLERFVARLNFVQPGAGDQLAKELNTELAERIQRKRTAALVARKLLQFKGGQRGGKTAAAAANSNGAGGPGEEKPSEPAQEQ